MVRFAIELTNQEDGFDWFRWFRKLPIQRPSAESMLMAKRFAHVLGTRLKRAYVASSMLCAPELFRAPSVVLEMEPSVGSQALRRSVIGRTSQCRGHRSITMLKVVPLVAERC